MPEPAAETRAAPAPSEADDRDVLRRALDWHRAGRRVALATVVRTWGSAPREAGSHMAVADDADFLGSVSGGCVESAVIQAAAGVLEAGAPRLLEFGVSDAEAWDVGLACGGQVAIRLEPAAGVADLLERALDDVARRRAVVLATPEAGGEPRLLHPLDGDAPDAADAADAGLLAAAREAVLSDTARTQETPGGAVFLRPYNPPPRLVIVGAVHIAQALARMAAGAGFDVVVVDPRGVFATEARFPGLRVERGWPDRVLDALAPDHRTAIVSLTHDPKLDDVALATALRGPAFFVGALGSRRTQERRLERLREQGFDADALARIHGPVGLDIGARTPAEIAVSILAQLVRARRGGG